MITIVEQNQNGNFMNCIQNIVNNFELGKRKLLMLTFSLEQISN